MRYLAIILWLCLTNLSLAQAWEPIDFKKWQSTENDTTFKCRIGGMIQNYPATSTSWAEIENDWVMFGDTMSARHAYLKTDILSNGLSQITIQHNDTTYTITQKPVRLIWLKMSTWNWIDIDSIPSWNTPSVDSNIIKWTSVFPGVDYKIRKRNATVEHGIFFKPTFIDSAIVLYDQRADSLDIALANVMEYTLSANIDDADVGVGNVNKRVLKQIGKHVFGLGASQLHFPGSDTLQVQIVNHRWVEQDGKIYCVEYIQMRKIKIIHEEYPAATIWHNDEVMVIDGQTNVLDTYLSSGNPDNAYGGLVALSIGSVSTSLIKVENVASELGFGATISACVCSLHCYANVDDGDISAYRVFKPWNEGTDENVDPADAASGEGVATWNDWSNDDEEWTTAGCGNADDGGSDNSGDGTGADRKATTEDTETVTTANTWYGWAMSTTLAQDWYDETINENGIALIGNVVNNFRSTEYTIDVSERPFWTFTYTTSYPVLKGYTSNNSVGVEVNSLTLTKPDDVANGDLLLLIAGTDYNGVTSSFDDIADWSHFVKIGNGATDCKLSCFWRIADGTEASTINVTTGSETDEMYGWYIRVSNVDQSTPINDVGTALLNASSSSHAITEATTDVNTCLVIYALAFDGGDGYPFGESNTGWVEEDAEKSGGGNNDACGTWGIKYLASAGGAGTVTISSGMPGGVADGSAAIQFAIAGPTGAPPPAGQVIIIK